MFHTKICGITTIDDGRLAVRAGADAIGLNFYAKSRRFVEPTLAAEIARDVSADLTVVGLFVNSSADAIHEIWEVVPLDVIQLHGDEPPEFLAELQDRAILRAFRFGPDGIQPIVEYLEQCERLGCMPQAVLIDAYAAGEYGGTGKQADWPRLAEERAALGDTPLILAGGLTPQNVAEAIRVVEPHGVDVSSGVEMQAAPGEQPRKDASLVQKFVTEAKAALIE